MNHDPSETRQKQQCRRPATPDLSPRRRRDDGPAVARIAVRLGRVRRPSAAPKPRRRSPSGSPSCSWATASTPTTGGPGHRAPRWNSARPSNRWSRSRRRSTSSTACSTSSATGWAFIPAMTGNLLSGVPITRAPIIHGGISMDQMLANRIGQDTAQPSLVLACEQPMTGYHETNYSIAYGSHISWQNADSPVPNEVYPSLAFDSLFENRGSLRNHSVLDRVQRPGRQLSRQVSSTDQAQARRIPHQRPRSRKARSSACAATRTRPKTAPRHGRPLVTMQRPDNGLPEDFREHARLMCDIIALAFQTDKTRIASLLLCPRSVVALLSVPRRQRRRTTPPRTTTRPTTTSASPASTSANSRTWPASSKRCPRAKAPCSTTSCLMFISNMWSGTKHDNTKVPVVTVGGLGGTLQTGRSSIT